MSFPACLFFAFGECPHFQDQHEAGVAAYSSPDRHEKCGRKIRVKCAGCNQGEKRAGRSADEVRNEQLTSVLAHSPKLCLAYFTTR